MAQSPLKPRRVRPSRARGLRTSTGCLTCRKRRIKCDEKEPRCGQCTKSDRECLRCINAKESEKAQPAKTSTEAPKPPPEVTSTTEAPPQPAIASPPPVTLAGLLEPPTTTSASVLSPDASIPATAPLLSPAASLQSSWLNNATAFQWFDLLAEDAINNIQRHNDVVGDSYRWDFDPSTLSRRQSPERDPIGESYYGMVSGQNDSVPSWNTPSPIPIEGDDLMYLGHYMDFIGPLLDLFDPFRHFTNVVPHLATRNVGLLKSILAVSARHIALETDSSSDGLAEGSDLIDPGLRSCELSKPARIAKQYYYETLRYLSQTLSYQSYADSHEILATAIMISTYEMFESTGPANNSEWERHLKGGFWIQRCQDNDGESADGLRRAVWWAWLRQDMWAAMRAGRPTLTIWCPTKNLHQLAPDEFATRIVYIAAKVVQYAGVDPESSMIGIQQRIDQGLKLKEALRAWDSILPSSFRPIITSHTPNTKHSGASSASSTTGATTPVPLLPSTAESNQPVVFSPVWVHPPSHAGAVQTYHLAMIILLLHIPNAGGLEVYRARQRQLDQSVNTICGIASQKTTDMPLAFVNIQALYTAGLCMQSSMKRAALLKLIESTIETYKFPGQSLIGDLKKQWGETS